MSRFSALLLSFVLLGTAWAGSAFPVNPIQLPDVDKYLRAHLSPEDYALIKNGSRQEVESYFNGLAGKVDLESFRAMLNATPTAPVIQDNWAGVTRYAITASLVDTGVDYQHPFFKNCMWTNEKEVSGQAGVDDDGNGLVDDIHGWNMSKNNNEIFDYKNLPADEEGRKMIAEEINFLDRLGGGDLFNQEYLMQNITMIIYFVMNYGGLQEALQRMEFVATMSHGTHCSGLMMNGTVSRLHAVRLELGGASEQMTEQPELPTQAELDKEAKEFEAMFAYMSKSGVRVVNISLGSQYSMIEQSLTMQGMSSQEARRIATELFKGQHYVWNYAISRHPELLFVIAAGNGGGDGKGDDIDTPYECTLPAALALDHVVAIAAINRKDNKVAPFSNFGKVSVDVASFGVSEKSTVPGGGYALMSGTSMASPNAANAAVRILEINPQLTPVQVKKIMMTGITPWVASVPTASNGFIDLNKCLEMAARSR